jgi:hypothetical protein
LWKLEYAETLKDGFGKNADLCAICTRVWKSTELAPPMSERLPPEEPWTGPTILIEITGGVLDLVTSSVPCRVLVYDHDDAKQTENYDGDDLRITRPGDPAAEFAELVNARQMNAADPE